MRTAAYPVAHVLKRREETVSIAIRSGVTLLAFAVLVACGGSSEQATESPGEARVVATRGGPLGPLVPRIDWTPCEEEALLGAECGVAEVPLDHGRPGGETTFVALARIPASDREHRLGSLFINPGGPGASGIDALASSGEALGSAVRGRYDLIGFDPRGVARSDALQCWATLDDFYAWASPILDFPYWRSQEREYFDAMNGVYPQCRSRHQRILEHMSTADVARDLDLLRRAVGDQRLNYLGWSYGTYLGQTYANLFPERVGAFVLDGVVDPIYWTLGLFGVRAGPAMDAVVGEFFRLCDEAGPEGCSLAVPGGAAARYQAALDRLMLGPVELSDGFVLHYSTMVVFAYVASYDPATWQDWAFVIGSFCDAVLGDAEGAGSGAGLLSSLAARAGRPSVDAEPYFTGYEAQLAVDCSDTEYPGQLATWSAMSAWLRGVSLMGPPNWWWASPCASWPVSSNRYVGPWSARTASAVLVVGNRYDPVTAYQNAVAVDRLLPRSRLLTYAGWGHCAFDKSECIRDHVGRYLVDGTLPPAGTVCPASGNPFLPRPAARLAPGEAQAPMSPIARPSPWLLNHLPR